MSDFDSVQQDDQALLQAAIAGDYDAFEQLHNQIAPAVSRFVGRLIGHKPEAEDIVQDTFLAFYLNMERIRPGENIRPYVFRIARNRCYDLLRRQGRYEYLSLDDEPTSVRVSFDLAKRDGDLPEDVAHWLLLHLEVQEAIDQLPELQRQTLILYAEAELTYAEIAAVMEVSIGTIKSRIHHAKKKLRGLVKPETLAAINNEFYEEGRTTDDQGVETAEQEARAIAF